MTWGTEWGDLAWGEDLEVTIANSSVTPIVYEHTHSLATGNVIAGFVITPLELSHSQVFEVTSVTSGSLLLPSIFEHLNTINTQELILAYLLSPLELTHSNIFGNIILDAGTTLLPSSFSHTHSLVSSELVTFSVITPIEFSHSLEIVSPVTILSSFINPIDLSHDQALASGFLATGIIIVVDALTHSQTFSIPGVQTLVASDLIQATAANRPTLSTVPGAEAAAEGFNSFLFDSTDSLSCEFNTTGTPVFYAWLDDGTEQTTYTSATGGVLTFNIPTGRKLLLAVAHPSFIDAMCLDKFRALANLIRGI